LTGKLTRAPVDFENIYDLVGEVHAKKDSPHAGAVTENTFSRSHGLGVASKRIDL
jgi:hypothetical protein